MLNFHCSGVTRVYSRSQPCSFRLEARHTVVTARWLQSRRLHAQSENSCNADHGSSESTQSRPLLGIMPIGGSITYGQGSTDGNGYRAVLRRLLDVAGYNIKMVGSRATGTMENNAHEGWRGYRIDQIVGKAQISLPKHEADIFLVNAGSNDCLQDFEIRGAGERMQQLLDIIWKTAPMSTILLSTLLVNADKEADARGHLINQHFQQLVKGNALQQRRILLVDMRGPHGPCHHHLTDGTHPSDEGYESMAKLWYRGIQQAIKLGLCAKEEVAKRA